MSKKIITIKKLSLTLIFGVIFFGMWSVFAACPSTMSSSTCGIPSWYDFDCRTDPTWTLLNCRSNWCARSTNDMWYNNNAVSNAGVMTSDEIIDYNAFVDYFGWSIWSTSEVRSIQETINKIGITNCWPVCEDWRFWNNTIKNLKNCLPCGGDIENWAKLEGDNLVCESWLDPDEDWCCEEVECITTISVSPDEYIEGEDIEVTVEFMSLWVFYRDNNVKQFQIEWWTPTQTMWEWESESVNKFTITPDSGVSQIKITSPEWKVEYNDWNLKCEEAITTINKNVNCTAPLTDMWDGQCCIPKNSWGLCENRSGFWLEVGSMDYSLLNWKKCDLIIPGLDTLPDQEFCPCDKPVINNSCEAYEDWYFSDGKWCCIKCWAGQTGDNAWWCKCDEAKKDECKANDEKMNDKTCKCECDPSKACCWIKLNTVVPFIGDCIEMTTQNSTHTSNWDNTSNVNQLNAFPFLMMGLSKILVTVILIFSFLIVISAWLLMVTWVYDEKYYTKWKDMITKVLMALILLWSSGLILKLINPSFFG